MNSRKQSIYDFFRENKKELAKNIKSAVFSNGVLTLTYPSGFKYELREEDFPTRNWIACYDKIDGKYIITHYVEDTEPIRSIPINKHGFSDNGITVCMGVMV